jgi:hypothetical protein
MINSGRTFVKAINMILNPINDFAEPYVDDIAVHSDDWTLHLFHLEAFLKRMRLHNVTLNLKKCIFAKGEVKFIGHVIGSGKKMMNPERIETLVNLKAPETKKQVKQVLGFFGYYRQFICNFAEIAKPLTDLTCKRIPETIVWTELHQKSLDLLKEKILSNAVLYVFEIGKPFNLYCDSSDFAVGAVLTQVDEHGIERPISFISQKLSDTQRRWATIEKEAYAIIWALNKLKEIITGCKIFIFSDHNPLIYLTESMSKSAKLVRWSLSLQTFDFELIYKRGKLNTIADFLSRL